MATRPVCRAEPDAAIFQWASRAASLLMTSDHTITPELVVRDAGSRFPNTKAVAYAMAFIRCGVARRAINNTTHTEPDPCDT